MPKFEQDPVISTTSSANAIEGVSVGGRGLVGRSDADYGIRGHSNKIAGIRGSSDLSRGVEGWATKAEGVVGISQTGTGVWGQTEGAGNGVLGTTKSGSGVAGISDTGIGVLAISESFEAVHAETKSGGTAAIAAYNFNPAGAGAAIFAKKEGTQGYAGFFVGNVHVTGLLSVDGDITLKNADCAEDFDIADADSVEPGTVMVLGDDESLHPCCRPYDKRVAGVVSGAGGYKPGIVLDKQQSQSNRKPIALLGKVFCKADARYGAIQVGDLLTTSPTPGHAMKTGDPVRAFGAVIGKALRPLTEGQELIPILIALQ